MSLRRGNAVQEAVEQEQAVGRAGAGLRVVLNGPSGYLKQLQPLDRAVVEVDVRERRLPEVGLPAHRLVGVDRPRTAWRDRGEAVVLGGDLDASGLEIPDRMVCSAVAERQLERLTPATPAEQLMSEADSPHGLLADELADRVDDVGEGGGVARAVGEEDRVGVLAEQ